MRKNLLHADTVSDRIYKFSGFSSIVLDSFSSPGTNPIGLTWDGTNLLNADNVSDRIYKFSGFSSIVLDSFSSPGTNPIGLAWDGTNLLNADNVSDRIYKFSGFSSIVLDSFSSPGTNPIGLAWDGTNLLNADNVSDRIYKFSGFSSIVLDSFSSPGVDPMGLVWDGTNLLHSDNASDRIYKFSGFSSIVLDSFSSPGTNPLGLAFEITMSTTACLELNNGDLLSVYNSGQGGTVYVVMSKKYDTSAKSWGSEVTIDSGNTGYTHPAIVQLASNASIPNRILCVFRDKAAGTINIFKSDDNGSSWASLTTITINLDENSRISLARSSNTICLVYSRGRVSYSRVSTDNGLIWGSENTISNQGRAVYPSVSLMDSGSFACAYQAEHISSNVYGRIYIASSTNGITWNHASSGVMLHATERYNRPSIAKDDIGELYVVAQDTVSKDLRIVKSTGVNGHTWGGVKTINPLPDQSNMGLYSPSICPYGGRIFIQAEAWDGVDGHLVALKAKNWRNINETVEYRDCYYPILGLPDIITNFALINSAGTATESGGILTLTTTSSVDSRLYKKDINNVRTTSGVKIRFKTEIDVGGATDDEACILRVQLSDGSKSSMTTLRFATSGVGIADGNKVDTWSSLTWEARKWSEFSDLLFKSITHSLVDDHEFLLAMKNSAVSIWYRNTHDKEIKWVSAVEGFEISQSGVLTESFLEFGIINAIATMKIHSLNFVENEDGLYNGFTTPGDLVPRKTATGSKTQHLKDGLEVTWGGSDGVVDDLWLIKSAYTFPKEDLVTDSPSDFVRTENDNAQHVYVLDAGVNKEFIVDQFNLIKINFRTGSFQMNNSDSWGSPTVNESFTVSSEITGIVTSINENIITDTALSLRINQLARPNRPMYLRMTSGIANGLTYKIESNDTTKIKLTTATLTTDGVAASNSYIVFIDRITKQITKASHRYIRLVIDSQQTADDYYIIGKVLFGIKLQLSKNFNSGYSLQIAPNISINKNSRAGQRFSVKKGESRLRYKLVFTRKTSAFMKEIEEFFESIDWFNNPFIFIKDTDNIQDFILGRMINTYRKDHIITDIFNINSILIEEEL